MRRRTTGAVAAWEGACGRMILNELLRRGYAAQSLMGARCTLSTHTIASSARAAGAGGCAAHCRACNGDTHPMAAATTACCAGGGGGDGVTAALVATAAAVWMAAAVPMATTAAALVAALAMAAAMAATAAAALVTSPAAAEQGCSGGDGRLLPDHQRA
jgi:hypothetical protein